MIERNLSSRWWLGPLSVRYAPLQVVGEPGDLLVGYGQHFHGGADDHVVLNHKLITLAQRSRSLTDYVVSVDAATVAAWRRIFPNGITDVKRFLVEDASLDTCLAILLFARAISPQATRQADELGAVRAVWYDSANGAQSEILWRAYVADWEEGRYTDGVDKRNSVGCLMACLAHSLLSDPGANQPPDDVHATQALVACLTLLDAYIAANNRPHEAPPPQYVPVCQLALSQYEFEYQQYLLALKYGIQTQLSVPLSGSSRSLLVDALLVNDTELSGILKVFARTDTIHTWSGRGFGLLGVRRPLLENEGGEITLSVDPTLGLSLELLWDRLEQLENERWRGKRPHSSPRRGIRKYSVVGTSDPLPDAPDQPWWDDHGRYTLIGSPKALQATGEPGSRLSWEEDVIPALWSLYRPFPDLRVSSVAKTAIGLVAVVHWHDGGSRKDGLANACARTMALNQWLAACSMACGSHMNPQQFLHSSQLHVLTMPGGDIVAHAHGVTLFDDWTQMSLDVPLLTQYLTEFADLTAEYRRILASAELASLRHQQMEIVNQLDKVGYRQFYRLRRSLLALKVQLGQLSSREAELPVVPTAALLHELLEKAWGLPATRRELREEVHRLDSLLVDAQTLLQEQRQFTTNVILGAAGIFFVLRDFLAVIASKLTLNSFETTQALFEKAVVDAHLAIDADPVSRKAMATGLVKTLEQAQKAIAESAKTTSMFDDINITLLIITTLAGLAFVLVRYLGIRRRKS